MGLTIENDIGLLDRALRALGRPAWEVTPEDIDRVVGDLAVLGRASSTRREYVQIFKGFHRFLQVRKAAFRRKRECCCRHSSQAGQGPWSWEQVAPVKGVGDMGSPRRKAGVLAPHVEGFRAWLARHGYTGQSIRNMLKDLGQAGLWLSGQGLEARDLDEERLEQHLADLRKAGRRRVAGPRGMVPLLAFLREAGVVPAAQGIESPAKSLLERYRSWMESERGLSAATMLRYENTARRFLAEQATAGGVFAPHRLTGADLNAFLLRECARVSAGSAKGRVAVSALVAERRVLVPAT
jgi:hypothetical protein